MYGYGRDAVQNQERRQSKGKPRVYFACPPEDFALYFEKIQKDIFETHDCAIYYTADMTEPVDEADLQAGLSEMNLFVVPVTVRLLNQPNRAMDEDIAYAKKKIFRCCRL